MKLYLSSFRLGNESEKLISLLSKNAKGLIIVNAKDDLNVSKRKKSFQQEKKDLESLGLSVEELDLRDYFGNSDKLRKTLNLYDFIWVRGGNAFILRRAMYQSGLDKLLKERVKNQNFVYAGYSAGVCVITPTLRGIELVDDPNLVPEEYKPDIIWDGIGLIDYSVAPHYRSNHPESLAMEKVVKYFIKHKMPYRTLHDGEVIIIDRV